MRGVPLTKTSLLFSTNGQNNSKGSLFPFKIMELIRPGKSTFLLCALNIYKILWNYVKLFERSCTDTFCHHYIHKWKNLCMKGPNFRQIMKSKSHCIVPLLFISTHVICAFTHCVHNIYTVSWNCSDLIMTFIKNDKRNSNEDNVYCMI